MKKGIIAAIVVVICVTLAATYAFAAPAKARKTAKTEPTTAEKKEVTTTEKEKTTTEATTESKKAEIKEETSEKVDTDQKSDNPEEISDQEEADSEDEDNEEIDDEKMDQCDHNWTDGSYAYDTEKGYVFTESCSKCHLVKDTPVSYEEYEEAIKDQEPNEEDCVYEDNEDVDVAE